MRQQGRLEESLRHHEAHLRIASEAHRSDEADAAHQNIVQVPVPCSLSLSLSLCVAADVLPLASTVCNNQLQSTSVAFYIQALAVCVGAHDWRVEHTLRAWCSWHGPSAAVPRAELLLAWTKTKTQSMIYHVS